MRLIKNISLLLILLCCNTLVAQDKSVYTNANNLFINKQYYKAIALFKSLDVKDNNSNLNYKIGFCYYSLNEESRALPYFEEAIKNTTKKYKTEDLEQVLAPMDAYYYFAKVQHFDGNLILAFEYYNKFYKVANKKDPLKKKALAGIYQCEIAHELTEIKQDFIIWNLGDTLNTDGSEYRPVISIDGSVVYFTSSRLREDATNKDFINPATGTYYEDIYASHSEGFGSSRWTKPAYLPFCKISQDDASVSLSLDGSEIFVYQEGNGNGDIYYSSLTDFSFENLKPFPAKYLNTNSAETHATLSLDGRFIYFVSDRSGGYGGKDIYRIALLPDGTWSKAMNLGPTINSEYDEESPFIGADSRTLYFSSNGINSIGGYDVFVSQLDPLNNWSTPENLGMPINSFGDDLYYSTLANGSLGVYASNRKNGEGNYDIYFVQTTTSYYKNVTIFKGYISSSNSKKLPEGITIHVKDITENSDEKIFTPRRKDGGYILNLKPCHSYQIEYKVNNKVFHKTKNDVPCNSSYQEIHEEIILDIINLKVVIQKKTD